MKPRLPVPAPMTEEDELVWDHVYNRWVDVAVGDKLFLASDDIDRRDSELMHRREYQRYRFQQLNAPRMPPKIFWGTYMVQYV